MKSIVLSSVLMAISISASAQEFEAALLDRVAENPGDASARLALAEIYFARNQDRTADFNLRQALAGGLEAEDRERALELLGALQKRRTWIVTVDAALAPEVEREFLIEDAMGDQRIETRSSGFGALVAASVENRLRIAEDWRWSTQGFVDADIFGDEDFNRVRFVGLMGPLNVGRADETTGTRLLFEQVWDGGESEFSAVGFELSARRRLSDRLLSFARATVRDVDHDRVPGRSGQAYSVDGAISRNGLQGRFEQIFGVVFRNEFESEDEAGWFLRAGVGAYREFPGAFGIYVEPSVALQDFDSGRQDWELAGRLRIVKQDWRVFGSAPFVSVTLTDRQSNIDGFDASSFSAQFGFTRTF